MTTIDYIPTFYFEDFEFHRYLYIFIVQNTNTIKVHKKKILEFLEEKHTTGINNHDTFGDEVSFTYILFDKEPTTFICHDINEFKEAFGCSLETELSSGIETLSSFLKKHIEEHSTNKYDDIHTMHNVFFIGDGNDYMDDKTNILNTIKEFRYYPDNHCIAFYTPDMQYMGYGDKDDERTHLFFQIKQPAIDWEGLRQSNLYFIKMSEDWEKMKKAREVPRKTDEQLLEEIKENLSNRSQENPFRFEVKDKHIFVHGHAELENREGFPVGDGIVFFCGKGECHHELYVANTLTGKIRQLSTAEGTLLVDDDEIDFEAIEKKCKHGKHNAKLKEIRYAGINRWEGFRNGICAISWMLYPEREDCYEEEVHAIMDTNLDFIEPFRPIKDIELHLTELREQLMEKSTR